MAIYIQLRRTVDNATLSIYEFGPSDCIAGSVAVTKPTGEVELIHIDAEFEAKADFYILRIRRVFLRHAQSGDFPERTCYAA
jgi:hypothetical protein